MSVRSALARTFFSTLFDGDLLKIVVYNMALEDVLKIETHFDGVDAVQRIQVIWTLVLTEEVGTETMAWCDVPLRHSYNSKTSCVLGTIGGSLVKTWEM